MHCGKNTSTIVHVKMHQTHILNVPFYHYKGICPYKSFTYNIMFAAVSLDQIKEVRNGKNTDILRNQDIAGHYPEECAFSIIYGDSYDTMDLIANSPDEANIWVTGLTCLVSGKDRKTGGNVKVK